MAKFEGHRCDRPECTNVGTVEDPSKQRLPDGWYTLDPHAPDGRKFDLCSAKCVRLLAGERERMDRPPKERAISHAVTGGTMAAAHAGNLTRWHKAGKHQDDPRPGCPMCEAETTPAEEVGA